MEEKNFMEAKVLKKISSVQFEQRYVLNVVTECITSHFRIIMIKLRNSRKFNFFEKIK